ncbi:MAG: alpha/beta hydrolase [Pseudomonadota bacterium]
MLKLLGRTVLRLAIFVVFLWGTLVGGLLWNRHAYIYARAPAFDAGVVSGFPRGEVARIDGPEGLVTVWMAQPVEGRPVVLHFTGNAGYLPGAARAVYPLVIRGFGTAIPAYPGRSVPGEPNEERLVGEALALYDALAALFPETAGPPVIWGTSLGAAVAVAVAAERPAAALVLEAPFAELCTVAQHHYPWAPACLLLWDERWESVDLIGDIDAPILILAGRRDGVIPVAEAERLAAAAPNGTRLVIYPDGAHSDLTRHGAMDEILAFLAAQGME